MSGVTGSVVVGITDPVGLEEGVNPGRTVPVGAAVVETSKAVKVGMLVAVDAFVEVGVGLGTSVVVLPVLIVGVFVGVSGVLVELIVEV